jgi:hypothetical protein
LNSNYSHQLPSQSRCQNVKTRRSIYAQRCLNEGKNASIEQRSGGYGACAMPRFRRRWYRSLSDDVETWKAAEQFTTHATAQTSTLRCTPPGYSIVSIRSSRGVSAPASFTFSTLTVLPPSEVAPSFRSACLTHRTFRGGQLSAMPQSRVPGLRRQEHRPGFFLRSVPHPLYHDILFAARHRPPHYSPTAASPRR